MRFNAINSSISIRNTLYFFEISSDETKKKPKREQKQNYIFITVYQFINYSSFYSKLNVVQINDIKIICKTHERIISLKVDKNRFTS